MLTLLSKGVPTKFLKFFWLQIFFICHRCQRHRWSTLSCEYLREFSKKFETVLIGYSGAGGKLIHEKNQEQKISWHCPFKEAGSYIRMEQAGILLSGAYFFKETNLHDQSYITSERWPRLPLWIVSDQVAFFPPKACYVLSAYITSFHTDWGCYTWKKAKEAFFTIIFNICIIFSLNYTYITFSLILTSILWFDLCN